MYELKKMEMYLRINLLGPGPRLMKKGFRAAVSQRLRNTGLRVQCLWYAVAHPLCTQTKDYKVAPPNTWLLTEIYSVLYPSRLVCMTCYLLRRLRFHHQTQSICILYELLMLKMYNLMMAIRCAETCTVIPRLTS